MQFLTKDLETHRVASVTLAVLFVLLGIVALCLNIPYNFFEVDEAYQAFSIRHYDSSPLALLTFFLGHVWTQIFGDTFFALRTLCMLCYLTAIGTATIFYYRRTGNRLFATLLFMTGCLLANLAGFGIYNWDTGAYPVECFGAIASLRYLERPTLRRSLLCGVLFGLMVLFRLPLAAVVLIWICLTSWLRHTRRLSSREYIAQLLLPLLVMVIVTIAIAALILAGSGGFAGLSGEDSLIKGHGASSIMLFIARFKYLFPMVFNSFFYMVLALMLAVGVEFVKINRRTAIVISILILLTAGWSMIGHFVKFDNNDCAIFGLGYPFFFITVAAPWFMRSTRNPQHRMLLAKTLLLTAYILLMALGSDTMFQRTNSSFMYIIAFAVIGPVMKPRFQAIMPRWVFFGAVLLIAALSCKNNHGIETMTTPPDNLTRLSHTVVGITYRPRLEVINAKYHEVTASGEKAAFLCFDRLFFDYIFGQEPVVSRQKFFIDEDMGRDVATNPEVEWLFVDPRKPSYPDAKANKILDILEECGHFDIVETTEDYVLLRRK